MTSSNEDFELNRFILDEIECNTQASRENLSKEIGKINNEIMRTKNKMNKQQKYRKNSAGYSINEFDFNNSQKVRFADQLSVVPYLNIEFLPFNSSKPLNSCLKNKRYVSEPPIPSQLRNSFSSNSAQSLSYNLDSLKLLDKKISFCINELSSLDQERVKENRKPRQYLLTCSYNDPKSNESFIIKRSILAEQDRSVDSSSSLILTRIPIKRNSSLVNKKDLIIMPLNKNPRQLCTSPGKIEKYRKKFNELVQNLSQSASSHLNRRLLEKNRSKLNQNYEKLFENMNKIDSENRRSTTRSLSLSPYRKNNEIIQNLNFKLIVLVGFLTFFIGLNLNLILFLIR